MAHEWIKANLAREYVAEGLLDYSAPRRICERAHAGLIAAKAERIIWQGKEEHNKLIGKGFWWAEGRKALEQDWQSGDFSTWLDNRIQVKAFGVSFDFVPLTELVPAELQASAMRKISVVGSENWISASDLHRMMSAKGGPFAAKLLEACQLGQIAGRAMRARRLKDGRSTQPDYPIWGAIEWDVPIYFWREFATSNNANVDWRLDKFSGRGGNNQGFETIELQGVYFHRSGLANLGLPSETEAIKAPVPSVRGRKPIHDWPAATLAVFGSIYRGELQPECQADVERALIDHLTKGDAIPSESTVRPYARRIWEESQKA